MIRIVITALAVLFTASCSKVCKESDYTFIAEESYSPGDDSVVHIGDTIWLTCNIPKLQTDISSQTQINYSDVWQFGITLFVSNILTFNGERPAINCFEYILEKGTILPNVTTADTEYKQLLFSDSGQRYEIHIGLIAKTPGVYLFFIPDVKSAFRNRRPKCGRADYIIYNKNKDNYLELFESRWGRSSEYDRARAYCIKVQ